MGGTLWGIKSELGATLSAPVQTGLGTTEPSVKLVAGLFVGNEAARMWH